MDMLQETMNAVVSLGRVKLAMYRSDMTEHIEIKSCFPTIIPRIVKIINYIKNRTPLDFVCCRDFSKASRVARPSSIHLETTPFELEM